jgi:hypothetical protein
MRKAKEKEETAIGKSPTITALNLSSWQKCCSNNEWGQVCGQNWLSLYYSGLDCVCVHVCVYWILFCWLPEHK